ncbi:stabilization protein [Sphingomonas sp. HMWF008]|nr:stabilization protein [Sphingomonas sp. HMWF008]
MIDIGEWIERDDPVTANRVIERLIVASEEIGERPRLYPLADGSRVLHRRLVRPYLIFYRVRRDDIFIVSIRYSARDNRALR